ncbi:MIP/aquaporin family protein [Mucilaginibacter sp.]|uniref:MIP/aquaporin family protein n=1 Tax=Mucilaginibacter sp. TaxID=1882438 RepID=UPI003B005D19
MINKNFLKAYFSEFIGTALLVLIGLSAVIFINGKGSPVLKILPNPGIRRAVSGFLFGTTGCLITLSPVGKISGAHINPIISITFWLRKNMQFKNMLGFIAAQMSGAALGCLPLLFWDDEGRSMYFGATVPAPLYAAFIGEIWTTFVLVAVIIFFTSHNKIKNFTPFMMPIIYCVMVFLEAPVSGTSTNPARSFGPAVISQMWSGYWLYWLAPVLGMLLAVLLFSVGWLKHLKSDVAKLYHFERYRHISNQL